MPLPQPESALDHLRRMSADAQEAIRDLLQISDLRAVAVSTGQHYEWHIRDSRDTPLRSKAAQLYRGFHNDMRWILHHHDRIGGDRLWYLGDTVFRIIDQHGHTQIASISDAEARVAEYFTESLAVLAGVFDSLEDQILIIPDTNVLIDFPALENYHLGLETARVVFTPMVLRELDNLKRRKDDSRFQAQAVIRQLKDSGDRGDILEGVSISKRLILMTVATEPLREDLLDWLDLDVSDDRFVASALEVRRAHPKAKLLVVSRDFNVLNKARAARLSAFDPEEILQAKNGK